MPRDLKRSDRNELRIKDGRDGSRIVLYFRQPTAEEYVNYHKNVIVEVDGKISFSDTARIDAAYEILTGFENGCMTADNKPISSVEGDENYDPKWKEMIRDTSADLLMALATEAFETVHKENKSLPFEKPSKS